jgi:predicted MPP superfamily phosphohydrolase
MLKKISIQVYSDLHIELMKQFPQIQPTAKYLFLVGDICQLNNPLFFKFFDYCSPKWEKIFYTPGNHEFYSGKKNYKQLDFEYQLKFRERYKNVFYLNNNSAPLNDEIDVYGCVFWTDSYNNNNSLNDYREINQFSETKKYNIPIDYKFMKSLSDESLKSISNYLNQSTKKTIVMTHFPPIQEGTSNPIYSNQPLYLKDYFAWNNILKDLNLNNVSLWLSGHTHWSYDILYNKNIENSNNTRLISNQLGYSQEIGFTNIVQDGLFEIDL